MELLLFWGGEAFGKAAGRIVRDVGRPYLRVRVLPGKTPALRESLGLARQNAVQGLVRHRAGVKTNPPGGVVHRLLGGDIPDAPPESVNNSGYAIRGTVGSGAARHLQSAACQLGRFGKDADSGPAPVLGDARPRIIVDSSLAPHSSKRYAVTHSTGQVWEVVCDILI